jgi:hypothetical protein
VLWSLGRVASGQGGGRAGAKKITDMQKALYSGPHEYGPVRVHDFGWLDSAHYDAMQRRLEVAGFQSFGDVEDLTLSAVHPNMRTAMRDMASGDGVVAACIWQLKLRGWLRILALFGLVKGDMRVVDLATEFSDGSFLNTANNLGLDPSSDVPGIERMALPNSTPIEEAVSAHRRRVVEILAARPGVVPVLTRTPQEYRKSSDRAHALKCAEKVRNNFVDLQQFAGAVATNPGRVNDPEVRAVAQELARVREGVN